MAQELLGSEGLSEETESGGNEWNLVETKVDANHHSADDLFNKFQSSTSPFSHSPTVYLPNQIEIHQSNPSPEIRSSTKLMENV
jgi:hypothetical protein